MWASTGSASRPARSGYAPHKPMFARTSHVARAQTCVHHARGRPHRPKGAFAPAYVSCAWHKCMLSRTTARCTCASSFSPCKGQVCTSRRSIRACASLIFAAHITSRPHQSALTVQEHVMTLAQAHFARTKHYGVCLERVSPRRRGHAHALSPWFATPVDAYLCATSSLFTSLGKNASLPNFVFDDSQSSSTAHLGFCQLLIVKHPPPKVIEGAGDVSDAQRFDHKKITKSYPILGDCIIDACDLCHIVT